MEEYTVIDILGEEHVIELQAGIVDIEKELMRKTALKLGLVEKSFYLIEIDTLSYKIISWKEYMLKKYPDCCDTQLNIYLKNKFLDYMEIDDIKTAEMILARGLPVNLKDNFGSNLLAQATIRKAWKIVRLLIKKGADIDAIDKEGKKASYYARYEKSVPEDIFWLLR